MQGDVAEWILVQGQRDTELSSKIERSVCALLESGQLSKSEVERVRKLDLAAVSGQLNIPDSQLEKLRRLCQVWDVDVRLTHLSSHRRYIGPLIVFFKRATLPVLRLLLKDTLRQQRDFNAAALALLSELCANQSKKDKSE